MLVRRCPHAVLQVCRKFCLLDEEILNRFQAFSSKYGVTIAQTRLKLAGSCTHEALACLSTQYDEKMGSTGSNHRSGLCRLLALEELAQGQGLCCGHRTHDHRLC